MPIDLSCIRMEPLLGASTFCHLQAETKRWTPSCSELGLFRAGSLELNNHQNGLEEFPFLLLLLPGAGTSCLITMKAAALVPYQVLHMLSLLSLYKALTFDMVALRGALEQAVQGNRPVACLAEILPGNNSAGASEEEAKLGSSDLAVCH